MSAPAVELSQTPPAPTTKAVRRDRILVVDDDREMCELLEAGLKQRDYEVTWCLEPEAALQALERDDYSALVVDIQMDGKSGLDLCRSAIAKRPNLPVLVMTGFGTVDDAVGAIRACASASKVPTCQAWSAPATP